jgi:hypothetical protein
MKYRVTCRKTVYHTAVLEIEAADIDEAHDRAEALVHTAGVEWVEDESTPCDESEEILDVEADDYANMEGEDSL